MSDGVDDNRTSLLTLWAAMSAEWLRYDPDLAVIHGHTAGSSEAVEARTLGVVGGELEEAVRSPTMPSRHVRLSRTTSYRDMEHSGVREASRP